jgi:predicted metal-binding membrane protein
MPGHFRSIELNQEPVDVGNVVVGLAEFAVSEAVAVAVEIAVVAGGAAGDALAVDDENAAAAGVAAADVVAETMNCPSSTG